MVLPPDRRFNRRINKRHRGNVRLVSTMPKREMTIGVTVNLQNYESLRIEIEDDVESDEDVRSLVAFLDRTLALFGQGESRDPEGRQPLSQARPAGCPGRGRRGAGTCACSRRTARRGPRSRGGCRAARARAGCHRAPRGGAGAETCAESRCETRSKDAGEDTGPLAHRRRLRVLRRNRERGRREDESPLRLEDPLQEVHPEPLRRPRPLSP